MAYDKKKLDTLVRQGMMPAKQLPILHRALDKLKSHQNLNPYEREAISKLLDKTMGFQFGDDVTYQRARLHTQRTKYQTEEQKVAEDKESKVVVHDGTEDEAEAKKDKKVKKNGKSDFAEAAGNRPADKETGDKESPKQGGSKVPEVGELCDAQDSKPNIKEGLIADLDSEGKRERATRLSRRKGKISKEKLAKALPAALRKEKQKAGLSEDLVKFNELYKENLDRALANNKVDNVRDIPEKIKQDLFKHVEEATYSNKQIKMAKGIAFDKRHKGGDMTGAYKKMEKIKKGLGDTKAASDALRRANEELELPLEEGKLKDYAIGHGYFDNSSEGKAKRKDPNWLSKQAGSKKTISYAKKKTVKEAKKASHDHDGDGKIESGKEEYFGSRDKAIKKALKKVDKAAVKEEDTKELPKNPNQAVRDVHKTVADVLAGKTIEVSDEPLVLSLIHI